MILFQKINLKLWHSTIFNQSAVFSLLFVLGSNVIYYYAAHKKLGLTSAMLELPV